MRIDRLRKRLLEEGVDATLIDNPIHIYYLTGIDLSTGLLFVTRKEAHLSVDGRYYEMCLKHNLKDIAVHRDKSLSELIKLSQNIQKLGFSLEKTSYYAYQQWKKVSDAISIDLIPIQDPISFIRIIKEDNEIALLKESAHLATRGYDFVLSVLKEGISEEEVAAELEIFWKREGGKRVAFDPIIAFGSHSAMPHYRAGSRRLKQGDIVLIDIGVVLNHYHSDMTRTLFFGHPDPKLKKIYEIVLEAQLRALNLCKPGTLIGDLDRVARDWIVKQGFGEQFTHSLGHGIGLEIHESPILRDKPPMNTLELETGMVITIEPGIYIPDLGGVRIEDSVIITPTGHENLINRSKEIRIL